MIESKLLFSLQTPHGTPPASKEYGKFAQPRPSFFERQHVCSNFLHFLFNSFSDIILEQMLISFIHNFTGEC